tara:strand:- start:134 stop:559 length:426 start_codon:yes stop_codon:yes gene_type:complete
MTVTAEFNLLTLLGVEDIPPPEVETKYCPRCKQTKPITAYHKHCGQADGLQSRCIECRKRENNNASTIIRKRMNVQRVPLGTPCDLCGRTDFPLQFDHCHKTEKHRGWLCRPCNAGLGQLGDDIPGLERAIDYLRQTESIP